MKIRCLKAIGLVVFMLVTFTARAAADQVIGGSGSAAGQTLNPAGLAVDNETGQLYVADQGNHRVDVFDAEGHFEMAFGWGVKDGRAELQVCTTVCRKGLSGGGAGEFGQVKEVAIDNDPTSPSHHDVYVLDNGEPGFENNNGGAFRVEKFTPTGEFLLTWGGGVIGAGASGSGDLSAGSNEIQAVRGIQGTFAAGQTITGAGI